MRVSVRSMPSTPLTTLREEGLEGAGVPDPHLHQVVPRAGDVVAFEHRRLVGDPREEARLDAGVAPADEDEGEQFQPERLRCDVDMGAGDDAALDQLPHPLVDRGDGEADRLAQLRMRGAPVGLEQRHERAVDGVEFGHGLRAGEGTRRGSGSRQA